MTDSTAPENAVSDFFDNQSAEEKQQAQSSYNKQDDEGGSFENTPVLPGKYVMEASSFAWEKDGKFNSRPMLNINSKGSLMATVSLKVTEGTAEVKKGSSVTAFISLVPKKGSTDEKVNSTMRMMKPQLIALTGQKEITIAQGWFEEFLTAEFEKQPNGKFKVIRDHKMKEKVYVEVNERLDEKDEVQSSVKYINKWNPGDKSYTLPPDPKAASESVKTAASPQADTPSDVNLTTDDATPPPTQEDDF